MIPLTPMEDRVVSAVCLGLSSAQIASDFGITRRTVENHRAAICRKLGSPSVVSMVAYAIASDIVPERSDLARALALHARRAAPPDPAPARPRPRLRYLS